MTTMKITRHIIFLTLILVGVSTLLGLASADQPDQHVCYLPLTRDGAMEPVLSPSATPELSEQVQIALWCSMLDAPGNDNENLNGEYVCIANRTGHMVVMTGWRLQDNLAHVYRFPSFDLAYGAHVKVHTGSGLDDDAHLYWGQSRAVWNNSGDSIRLYDESNQLVDRYDY